MVKVIQREIEASIGGVLLNYVIPYTVKKHMKKNRLVAKKVSLPKSCIDMNYLEREPIIAEGSGNNAIDMNNEQPTLLFCHGLGRSSEDYAEFITSLNIPPHIRILCPDQIGHGKDLKRVRSDPGNFIQPTSSSMLESTSEFLDEVKAGNNCNAFGISMGGWLVYFLRIKRPDIIQRTVLVAPAFKYCSNHKLMKDFLEGRHNFMCFESREDVKWQMRELSTGQENNDKRKKKDPVPKWFLESIYRAYKTNIPEGHRRAMMYSLLKDDDAFSDETDTDRESPRLVVWPDHDTLCNFEKGNLFFKDSINTEFETIPNCGHFFHGDGTTIYSLITSSVRKSLLDFSSS